MWIGFLQGLILQKKRVAVKISTHNPKQLFDYDS